MISTHIHHMPIQLLVDTGAMISVIDFNNIPEGVTVTPYEATRITVGANGQPLNMVGQVNLSICFIPNVTLMHAFVVVSDLPVAGILGAEFLVKHSAVVDLALHIGGTLLSLYP